MRRLLITEEEKRRILGLYGLLKEDIDPNSGGTVTINNVYKAGWYTTAAVDQLTNKTIKDQLDVELLKVTEFVRKNPNSIVSVKFTSQESAIPNTDNEKAGFFKDKPSNRLDVGELSGARKDYLNQYIQSYFQTLKDEGIINSEVQIPPIQYEFKPPVKPFMGDKTETPWCIKGDPQIPATDTQGYTCTGSSYKVNGGTANNWYNQKLKLYKSNYDEFVKEQNSSIEITVKLAEVTTTTTTIGTSNNNENVTPGCATDLEIIVYVKSHDCQNAEYLVYANNTLLTNLVGGNTANLNNAGGYLLPKSFNFTVPEEGGSYLVDMSEGGKTNAFDKDTELIAQVLNPAYGYTKNGPYTPKEDGDIGKSRSDTFKVTSGQSQTIIEQGNGKINVWLVGTTKSMHLDIPYVLIKKDGKTVYDGQPKIEKGLVLTLNGCGTEVIDKDTTATAPTGYEQILVQMFKDRLDAVKKGFKDPEAIKKLSKKQKIDVKSVLLERTKILDNLIQQVYQIYSNANGLSKSIGEMKKIYNSSGNKVARTNIFNQIQVELDGSPSFRKMDPSNGWVSTYVDQNIEDSRKKPEKTLLGDVFLKLQQFYQYYKYFYFNTDTNEYVKEGLTLDEISDEGLPSDV